MKEECKKDATPLVELYWKTIGYPITEPRIKDDNMVSIIDLLDEISLTDGRFHVFNYSYMFTGCLDLECDKCDSFEHCPMDAEVSNTNLEVNIPSFINRINDIYKDCLLEPITIEDDMLVANINHQP